MLCFSEDPLGTFPPVFFFFFKIPPTPLSYPRGDRFPQKRYIPPRVLRYNSISRHFSMHPLYLFQRLSTAYVHGQDEVVNVVKLKEGESPPASDPAKASDGGVHLSSSGRPQRRTRAKGAQPLAVTCSSGETINVFKLKVKVNVESILYQEKR